MLRGIEGREILLADGPVALRSHGAESGEMEFGIAGETALEHVEILGIDGDRVFDQDLLDVMDVEQFPYDIVGHGCLRCVVADVARLQACRPRPN
jgi:hypothetical protein